MYLPKTVKHVTLKLYKIHKNIFGKTYIKALIIEYFKMLRNQNEIHNNVSS